MTVRVYRSSDVGAPTLNNTAGSMIGVLDWCLVSGSPVPSGWTKEYSGTNKAAYKQGMGSNGFYLRVDDSALLYATVSGYTTMSSVDVGDGVFPRPSQTTDGSLTTTHFYIVKSDGTNSNPREWVVVATEKLFYLYTNRTGTIGTYTGAYLHGFGDFVSHVSGDQYNTILISSTSTNVSYNDFPNLVSSNQGISGHVAARSYHQLGGPVSVGKSAFTPITRATMGGGSFPYPDPVSGDLKMFPVYICEGEGASTYNVTRGKLPGVWAMCHNLPLQHGDTFGGKVGTSLEGKTFECFRTSGSSGGSQTIIEISDTW